MDTNTFFGKLFDFSFKEFITLQVIKYLYILGIVFAALYGLVLLFGGFFMIGSDTFKGIFFIIISPLVFILFTVLARLSLEAIVATFRIAENTTKLVEQGEHK